IPFIRTNSAQALPFCIGLQSSNPIFGRAVNPVSAARSAGGGSFGEACALALHASTLGVGVDLAGGTRIPAHFCGVTALRPTPQRLSAQGLLNGLNEVPACVSPMAREVSGLVAFMRAACGPAQEQVDPRVARMPFNEDMFSSSRPLKIGYYTEDQCTKTTPPVFRAIIQAKKYLVEKGHKLVHFEPPDMKYMLTDLLFPATMGSSKMLWQLLSQDVVDESCRDLYRRAGMGASVRWMLARWRHAQSPIELATERSAVPETMTDWWQLTNQIQDYRHQFLLQWKQAHLDALLCPVFPCAAVKHANENRFLACLTHVGLFSLLNYPAGTVSVTKVTDTDLSHFHMEKFRPETPLETLITQDQVENEADGNESAVGLPVGVQVAALPFHEETVLRLMLELEQKPRTDQAASTGDYRHTQASISLSSESQLGKISLQGRLTQARRSTKTPDNESVDARRSGKSRASDAKDSSVSSKKSSKAGSNRQSSDLNSELNFEEDNDHRKETSQDWTFYTARQNSQGSSRRISVNTASLPNSDVSPEKWKISAGKNDVENSQGSPQRGSANGASHSQGSPQRGSANGAPHSQGSPQRGSANGAPHSQGSPQRGSANGASLPVNDDSSEKWRSGARKNDVENSRSPSDRSSGEFETESSSSSGEKKEKVLLDVEIIQL
ncbi:hypothetical protein EGW08_009095, partial [Elysia chlorotica]